MAKILKVLEPFIFEDEVYFKVSKTLEEEMMKGLSKIGNPKAKVKMFPTYVRNLPNGNEEGKFLALDLGGTNFRVLLIELQKNHDVKMKNKIYPIPETIMKGTGEQLFDHIALCIADFSNEYGIKNMKLPLGFTFSFPCKQEGLDIGRLVTWTKGFDCSGVVNENVVELLDKSIRKVTKLDIKCVAVLNDTVGCLMSCAYLDQKAEIGVILGTGTNACYMEQRLKDVQLWDGDMGEPSQVVINTEWGAFGDDGCLSFIQTEIDHDIDRQSINPGKQQFEKMISGMYMGEIVRLIVCKCVSKNLMFAGKLEGNLKVQGAFKTKYVSHVEEDVLGGKFENTKNVLNKLAIVNYTDGDLKALLKICSAVSERAAKLSASGIATLMNRINKPDLTVAVDGSLFRFHPHFDRIMKDTISVMYKYKNRFKLMLSEDGSGKGAALVAAVAWRLMDN